MATLSSVARHSIGDLTLYHFKFSSIATDDTYAVTNMPGAVGAWCSPWAGTSTLGSMSVDYTNSSTGVTISFTPRVDTTTGSVFVLGLG